MRHSPKAVPSSPAQTLLIERIRDGLRSQECVRAAWLSGSLARGTADAYSDIDVWLVVAPRDLDEFVASWPTRCAAIIPTVFLRQVGHASVFNAITPDWQRFDVTIGVPDDVDRRTRSTLRVLFDKDGLDNRLRPAGDPLKPDPRTVESLIIEFFRVLGLLPVVLGRKEYVLAVSGVELLRTMLIRLMCEDVAVEDRGGALHLSTLLPADRLRALAELPAMEATAESATACHLGCAELFLPLATELAARVGVQWPTEMETACRQYLQRELDIALP